MPWTAKLDTVAERKGGMVHAVVVFTSDDPTIPPIKQPMYGDDFSVDALKLQVAYRLRSLNAHDAAFASFAAANLKVGDTIEPAEIPDERVK